MVGDGTDADEEGELRSVDDGAVNGFCVMARALVSSSGTEDEDLRRSFGTAVLLERRLCFISPPVAESDALSVLTERRRSFVVNFVVVVSLVSIAVL